MTPTGIQTETTRIDGGVRMPRARARSTSTSTSTSTDTNPGPKAPCIVTAVSVETKTCNRCLLALPRSAFYKMSSAKDGLQSCCIACRKEYLAENRQHTQHRHASYLFRTGRSQRIGRRRALPRGKGAPTQGRLSLYGITWAEYEDLLVWQGGRCAICLLDPARGLAVDHDHDTGDVRGLLCGSCNMALGAFGDTAELLLAAIAYVGAGHGSRRCMGASRLMVGGVR